MFLCITVSIRAKRVWVDYQFNSKFGGALVGKINESIIAFLILGTFLILLSLFKHNSSINALEDGFEIDSVWIIFPKALDMLADT